MAAKKPKKMNHQKVRGELELIALGANGGEVSITDDFPNLQTCLYPDAMRRLSYAIQERYFREDVSSIKFMFEIVHLEKWKDFDTLAAAVVEERFRLDSIIAQPK